MRARALLLAAALLLLPLASPDRLTASPAASSRLEQRFSSVVQGLECIHRGEGSWRDGGAPYWGGLQMDADFQRTWGGELLRRLGPADRWTPFQQVAVAVVAWTERGFEPWPLTSRRCGLR